MNTDECYVMPCCKQVCHLSCIHEFVEYRNGYFYDCMFCRSHHIYNDEDVNTIIFIILIIVLTSSSVMLYFYIASFQ